MQQHMWPLAAGIAATLLLGACASTGSGGGRAAGAAKHTPTSASPPAAGRRARPPCGPAALALRYGPPLSPMTGEHGDFYAPTNRGASACTLAGYAAVTLYDGGSAPLPFRYSRGHGPMSPPGPGHGDAAAGRISL